jgi:hypothetical protein
MTMRRTPPEAGTEAPATETPPAEAPAETPPAEGDN